MSKKNVLIILCFIPFVIALMSWVVYIRWQQLAPLPVCPAVKLMSIPCLACGGTRCIEELLAGDIYGAFVFHPGLVLSGLFGILFYLYEIVFVIKFQHLWKPKMTQKKWQILLFTILFIALIQWLYSFVLLPLEYIGQTGYGHWFGE